MLTRFLAAAIMAFGLDASAATFDFSTGAVGSTFTKTDAGITAVFTATLSGGPSGTVAGGSFVDVGPGFVFGPPFLLEFTMVVDQTISLSAIDGVSVGGDTFAITGPGVSTSGLMVGQPLIGGPIVLLADGIYTLSTLPAISGEGSYITAMRFATAPLPMTGFLALSGLVLLGGLGISRQIRG